MANAAAAMVSHAVLSKAPGMVTGALSKEIFESSAPTLETKRLITGMLAQSGVKAEVAIPVKSRENFYSPYSKTIALSSGDPAVALHEAGHAEQWQKHPHLAALADQIAALATPTAIATAFLPKLTESKTLQELEKYSPLIALIMNTPRLALEYDASRRALAYVKHYRPDLYEQVNEKLTKALQGYTVQALVTPAALSAGLAAEHMAKKASIGAAAGKGIGLVLNSAGKGAAWAVRSVPGWVSNSVTSTGKVLGDVIHEKGVLGKTKALAKGLVGADTPTTTLGGKLMRATNIGLASLTPILAVHEIKKHPGDFKAIGEGVGETVGQALGGGALLGTALLGTQGRKIGGSIGGLANRVAYGVEDYPAARIVTDHETRKKALEAYAAGRRAS